MLYVFGIYMDITHSNSTKVDIKNQSRLLVWKLLENISVRLKRTVET